jgi:hypothetical protein
MNRFNLIALCLAATLGLAACDDSKPDSRQAQAAADRADAVESADKDACDRLSGNAKDICMADAKGRANIALAERAFADKPTDEHRFELLMARADAAYAVAKERCDDLSGNANDVCRKEAERAYATAKADATLAEKVADAQSTAREATSEAVEEARETTGAAIHDAVETKQDAGYAVALEKCDAFAGDARKNCIERAKADYAQN